MHAVSGACRGHFSEHPTGESQVSIGPHKRTTNSTNAASAAGNNRITPWRSLADVVEPPVDSLWVVQRLLAATMREAQRPH